MMIENQEILIVLGAPNSPKGALSNVSKERLDYCLKMYKKDMLILCTGGWGEHFNTAKEPHAFYTKNYLIENGIPESAFLPFALSQNTVDDAVKIKQIIATFKNVTLNIITSDFHVERVQLIFNEILKNYKMNFFGVKTTLDHEERIALIAHEKKAVEKIIKNGLYY